MAKQGEPGAAALRELLLQFQRSPGQFNLGLRQPAPLFASLREVLQIAIGRDAGEADEAQAAACFFVQAALLHPGADHYTLLGLSRGADPAAVKERYRLMMRLLHPDFAGGSRRPWPPDTPARINLAYEVLSDPERRRQYDLSRAEPPGPPPAATPRVPVPVVHRTRAPRTSWRHTSRARLKTLMLACALVGSGLALLALAPAGRDADYLVQRPRAIAARPSGLPESAAVPPAALADAAAAPAAAALLPVPQATPASAGTSEGPANGIPSARPASAEATPTAAAAAPQALAIAPPPPATAAPEPAVPEVAPGRLAVGKVTDAPAEKPASAAPLPSLAEAQPLLARVLHSVESARGEALVSIVEREGRQNLAVQGLARQIDALGGGAKVTSAQFNSEPADGRLVVTGQMRVDAAGSQAPRRLTLRMEFASRSGAVVLTALSGGWAP